MQRIYQTVNKNPLKAATILIALTSFLPFTISETLAQSNPMQVWFTYNQQARLNKKWGYLFDLNHRITYAGNIQSIVSAARAGINYIPNDHLRIAAGYAWFGQHIQGSEKNILTENRIWQQALWNRNKPGLSYFHRVRLEERFREISTNVTGKRNVAYTTRLRYMLQFQGPLLKAKKQNGFGIKWQVADELMLHAGEYVHQHYFEQNRIVGGIVLAPSQKMELAILYQFTAQYFPIPERMQQLHTIRLTLQHSVDFWHH